MASEAAITKPVLPPLQTPKSASFPSEIVSTPMSAHPLSAFIKQEQDLKTPITPPTAYTDFLKALTPILASPPPSALGRTLSDDSITSNRESVSSGSSRSSTSQSYGGERRLSPTSIPTPLSAPIMSGRGTPTSLKNLRIPAYSPLFSPNSTNRSPRTAMSVSSSLYSPFSPADWTGRSNYESIATPRSACSKPVSVRSVVTRTVTYKRTTPSLEPAPKGKRRKTASVASSITSKETTPELTKSKLDRIEETAAESPQLASAEVKQNDGVMPPPAPPVINVSPASTAAESDNDASDASASESSSNDEPSP